MTSSAKGPGSIAEDIAVSGEVERVITSATNLLELSHLLCILSSMSILRNILLCLKLLSLPILVQLILLVCLEGE